MLIELKGVEGAVYPGPIMVPPEHLASYRQVQHLTYLGENFIGPFYTHHDVLEVTLDHGVVLQVGNVPENRLALDMYLTARKEGTSGTED